MKKQNILIGLFMLIILFSISGQEWEDRNKKLELSGNIETSNKSNFELSNCIAHFAMIMGITSYTASEKEATASAFVEGNYSYSYYVNDYETQAGVINFKYSYQINDGIISYNFYDFEHDGNETEFQSIGYISETWNDEIGKIFTEKQYYEIMKDLYGNSALAIKLIKKNCLN